MGSLALRWFWVSLLGLLGASLAAPRFEFVRYELYELVATADVVVSGTIVGLDDSTYQLAVDRWIVGEGGDDVTIRRFQDWTCAGRFAKYAVGQSMVVFATRGTAPGAPLKIVGAGDEGELFLDGGDVIARGYAVHGYASEDFEFEGDYGPVASSGPRIPLDEFAAAVSGFRQVFAWKADRHGSRGQRAYLGDVHDRQSAKATDTYAATSKTAHFLWYQAVSSAEWPRPVVAPERRLESLPRLDAQDLGESLRNGPDAPLSIPATDRGDIGFGQAAAYVGDVDGDGRADFAIGAPHDSSQTLNQGALWLLFQGEDGTPRAHTELTYEAVLGAQVPSPTAQPDGEAAQESPSLEHLRFGAAVAPLGDLDGNGACDLAVSTPGASALAKRSGEVWVLLLEPDGSIKSSHPVISSGAVRKLLEEAGDASAHANFGTQVVTLGDLDGDLLPELLISSTTATPLRKGATIPMLVVSLDTHGEVRWARPLGPKEGLPDFPGDPTTIVALGDLDGDRICDLAIGAPRGASGFSDPGGVWLALLNPRGQIRMAILISDASPDVAGVIGAREPFGTALGAAGDLTGDGIPDLLVGSNRTLYRLELNKSLDVTHIRPILTSSKPVQTFACPTPVGLPGLHTPVPLTCAATPLLLATFQSNLLHTTTVQTLIDPLPKVPTITHLGSVRKRPFFGAEDQLEIFDQLLIENPTSTTFKISRPTLGDLHLPRVLVTDRGEICRLLPYICSLCSPTESLVLEPGESLILEVTIPRVATYYDSTRPESLRKTRVLLPVYPEGGRGFSILSPAFPLPDGYHIKVLPEDEPATKSDD